MSSMYVCWQFFFELKYTDKDNSDQISSLGHQSKNHKTI